MERWAKTKRLAVIQREGIYGQSKNNEADSPSLKGDGCQNNEANSPSNQEANGLQKERGQNNEANGSSK